MLTSRILQVIALCALALSPGPASGQDVAPKPWKGLYQQLNWALQDGKPSYQFFEKGVLADVSFEPPERFSYACDDLKVMSGSAWEFLSVGSELYEPKATVSPTPRGFEVGIVMARRVDGPFVFRDKAQADRFAGAYNQAASICAKFGRASAFAGSIWKSGSVNVYLSLSAGSYQRSNQNGTKTPFLLGCEMSGTRTAVDESERFKIALDQVVDMSRVKSDGLMINGGTELGYGKVPGLLLAFSSEDQRNRVENALRFMTQVCSETAASEF